MHKSRNFALVSYSLLILLSSIFTMIDVHSSRFVQGLCQALSSLDSLPFKFFVINFVELTMIYKINPMLSNS